MFFTSFAETYIHFFIQYIFYFSPFVSGISINNATIPTSPITTPRIIFPNTMHRLIPIPRRSAPKIANTTVPRLWSAAHHRECHYDSACFQKKKGHGRTPGRLSGCTFQLSTNHESLSQPIMKIGY